MRAAGLWALGSGQRDCLFILPEPSAQCPAALFNSAPQKAIKHRHLHHHSIKRLADDDAARSVEDFVGDRDVAPHRDRKSTRLNSSHVKISYAVFFLKKKNNIK